MLGDKKTALFVIISDTDDTFNFIVSIMYTQLFNLLCDKADDVYNGRLPVHVRCLLDEFANIGQIPKFEKLIATIRSREISASIILQSKSQLKAIYKDNADTIEGNCDTTLFLGGKEKTTLKELAEVLGKETIDLYNTSDSRGTSRSYGLNYQKTGKELMSQDEIAVMDGGKCIMQLRGVRPFFSDKFDITKHKQYHLLSDYDEKNTFDVEKYVKNLNRAKVKKDDLEQDLTQIEKILQSHTQTETIINNEVSTALTELSQSQQEIKAQIGAVNAGITELLSTVRHENEESFSKTFDKLKTLQKSLDQTQKDVKSYYEDLTAFLTLLQEENTENFTLTFEKLEQLKEEMAANKEEGEKRTGKKTGIF